MEADRPRVQLEKLTGRRFSWNILEVKNPTPKRSFVAGIAEQSRCPRVLSGRAMRKTSPRAGAGRAFVSRCPAVQVLLLHTLRANIDRRIHEGPHTFRRIGVKVWIYKGDIDRAARSPAGRAGPAWRTPRWPPLPCRGGRAPTRRMTQ